MDAKIVKVAVVSVAIGFLAGFGCYAFTFCSKNLSANKSLGGCFLSKVSETEVLGDIDGKEINSQNLPPDLRQRLLEAEGEHFRRLWELVDEAAVR